MQTARVNMCVCGHICVFVMPSDISQQASLLSAHQIGKCNHNKVAAKRIFFSQEEEGWGDVK